MSELLTSKIRLLNRDERNTELSKCFPALPVASAAAAFVTFSCFFSSANEILALQRQLMDLRELSNAARTETEIKGKTGPN